ncbi:unnamed protein product, partial [Rotaria socialis]
KITNAEPSLSNDSRSINAANDLLAPDSCNNVTTATGSVALRILPNIKASIHDQ